MTSKEKFELISEFHELLGWHAGSAFGSSEIWCHLMLVCAESVFFSKPLRMKAVYSTNKHSHAALRKNLGQLQSNGFLRVRCSEGDRRTKCLDVTENCVCFFESYVERIQSFLDAVQENRSRANQTV